VLGVEVNTRRAGAALCGRRPGAIAPEEADAMTQTIPRSRSRKVNGYVKAVLALEAVRRKREERYDRFVRPLDRKRDLLVAEVAARGRALSGGQYAEARRIISTMAGANPIAGVPVTGT
jgi:hypothetical protein